MQTSNTEYKYKQSLEHQRERNYKYTDKYANPTTHSNRNTSLYISRIHIEIETARAIHIQTRVYTYIYICTHV